MTTDPNKVIILREFDDHDHPPKFCAWGKHLLIDAADCHRGRIKSEETIKEFLIVLVERIDMVAYGDPILAHFATHDPGKGGYTFCQMISTSLIDGHLVDATGEAYISVHSCQEFDNEIVVKTVKEYFQPVSVKIKEILRRA